MNSNYFAQIEAILFAYAEPISICKLAMALGLSEPDCKKQICEFANVVNNDYNRGVQLIFLEDSVQLTTKKEFFKQVELVIEDNNKNYELTAISMEVLAIIAYNQPVTKGFIEQIRGTNSNGIVNSLLEKGLIEEAGRLDVPGKPIGYKTTKNFLRTFGLSDLNELPLIEDLKEEQISLEEEIAFSCGDVKC